MVSYSFEFYNFVPAKVVNQERGDEPEDATYENIYEKML